MTETGIHDYADLFNQISDALISTDMEFRVVSWNRAAERIYGWQASEVIGHPLAEFVQTEYAGTTREEALQAFLLRSTWQGEVFQHRKDGSRFPVLASVSVVKDPEGKSVGVVSINRDISEQAQIQEKLRDSEERFSKAFYSTPTALVLTRLADSRFESVNQSFLDLIGYSFDEVIGRSPSELNHFPDPDQMKVVRQRLLESGTVRNLDTIVRTKHGELRQVLFSADIIQLQQQPYSLTTMIDITDRVRAENKVNQLTRMYATLSQVNSTIVHTQNRSELFQAICDVATQFGGFALAWIGLLEAETGIVKPVAASGADLASWPFPEINIFEGELKNGLIPTALKSRKVITSEDIQFDAGTDPGLQTFRRQMLEWDFQSVAVVPFYLQGTPSGALTLASQTIGLFTAPEELVLLEEMSGDITFALNAMEIEQDRERATEDLRNSQESFAQMFDRSPAALILSRRADGKIIRTNQAYSHLMGYQPEEVSGRLVQELNIYADLSERNKILDHMREYGSISDYELTIQMKSGELRTILLSMEAIQFSGEECLLSSLLDISQRIKHESQIERQLDQLNSLRAIDMAISANISTVETLSLVVSQVATQLRVDAAAILLLNQQGDLLQCVACYGFHSQEVNQVQLPVSEGLAGRAVRERQIVHVSDVLTDSGPLGEMLKSAGDELQDYYGTPLFAKDQIIGVLEIYHHESIEPYEDWLSFFETLAGQAAIAIENAHLFERLQQSNADLERRVAERTAELSTLNSELERANRTKDEFLASMSHELRTPLNGILGNAEILLEQVRGSLNERQQHSVQMIEDSGRHLLALINDILDLARIGAGKLELKPDVILVDDLCKSSLSFIKEQALKKSILVQYERNPAVSSLIADPRRLKQILVNLLSNAVKFTPEHGQISLEVRADAENGLLQFIVADTGIGIAAEDLDRLFKPFVQVDSNLNRQFEGTGLGLALVQKLTELYGGSVTLESELGKGSRFMISLPWAQTLTSLEPAVSQLDTRSHRAITESPPGKLVLLAEDNTANILMMGDYLETRGFQVVIARNGLEAIEKTELLNPNVILMDIQMPTMDGLEATRLLRANPRFSATPIIALTALAMPGDRERCLEAGVNEYLTKPVSLKQLVKTILEIAR